MSELMALGFDVARAEADRLVPDRKERPMPVNRVTAVKTAFSILIRTAAPFLKNDVRYLADCSERMETVEESERLLAVACHLVALHTKIERLEQLAGDLA